LLRQPVLHVCCAALFAPMLADVMTVQLQRHTVDAYTAYLRAADERVQRQMREGPFLWVDASPERKRQVRAGKIIAEPYGEHGETPVPDGLIHDWIGAAFIPGTTVAKTLALVQDYNHHKEIYTPEELESRLISRKGLDFHIYMRVLKKQVLTVVLDTEHDVHYGKVSDKEWYSRSRTTRVAEVEKPGESYEHVLPPGTGHGFMWRLDTFWRFAERDGGVYIECEAISLTRDVPTGLGWIINPIIRSLPRESLTNTLRQTKAALTR